MTASRERSGLFINGSGKRAVGALCVCVSCLELGLVLAGPFLALSFHPFPMHRGQHIRRLHATSQATFITYTHQTPSNTVPALQLWTLDYISLGPLP